MLNVIAILNIIPTKKLKCVKKYRFYFIILYYIYWLSYKTLWESCIIVMFLNLSIAIAWWSLMGTYKWLKFIAIDVNYF